MKWASPQLFGNFSDREQRSNAYINLYNFDAKAPQKRPRLFSDIIDWVALGKSHLAKHSTYPEPEGSLRRPGVGDRGETVVSVVGPGGPAGPLNLAHPRRQQESTARADDGRHHQQRAPHPPWSPSTVRLMMFVVAGRWWGTTFPSTSTRANYTGSVLAPTNLISVYQ